MDETYDNIILTHSDLFDSNNQIDTFKQEANSALKAFQNLKLLQLPKQQSAGKMDFEQLKDIVSIPNTVN